MNPPDIDLLSLSDSDSDDPFAQTPAPKKSSKGAQDRTGDAKGTGKPRGEESHYTAEEAREQMLRQELESVRNVNRVIEGVVESLQKARDNMDVRTRYHPQMPSY